MDIENVTFDNGKVWVSTRRVPKSIRFTEDDFRKDKVKSGQNLIRIQIKS